VTDRADAYVTPALARWRRWTDGPLIVIAIGSLPFLLLELRSDELSSVDRTMVLVINIIVLIAFAVDYVVELALASNRRRYARTEWASLVIVLSQALALVPGFQAIGVLRALRGARAGRIAIVGLRVIAIGSAATRDSREWVRKHAAMLALGSAALTWLSAAAAFTIAEGVQDDGELYSFADSLWWATTTITTVGYGDIAPQSAAGRLVAGVTMIVGISTFAVVTAKVAEFLVRVERSAPEAPSTAVAEAAATDS
jgi:voltage-gated potassium channel